MSDQDEEKKIIDEDKSQSESENQSKVDEIEKFKLLEQDKEAGHTYRMKSAGYGVF